jgi:hypothetical protein
MSSDNVLSRFAASLEGIPKMIATAITKRSETIKNRVEKEIDAIVEDFNIEQVVREIGGPLIHNALTQAIEDHLKSRSGQQSIKDHLDKVLTQVTPESPDKAVPDATLAERVEEEAKTTPLFLDPLTLTNLQSLKPQIYIINDLSPLTLVQAVDNVFNPNNVPTAQRVLVVSHDDITKLNPGGVFDSFFDPITDREKAKAGQVGTLYGMEVYSDAFAAEKFLDRTGLLVKPVEVKTTTSVATMAEVPAA